MNMLIYAHAAKAILKYCAVQGELVPFRELQEAVGVKHSNQLAVVLKEVLEDCVENDEPLYPALVVGKEGRPGKAFFTNAARFGRYVGETEAEADSFWRAQLSQFGIVLQT